MIAILMADGFEEIEALTPLDILRRAGLDAKTVAINSKIAIGSHGISVICDLMADEVNFDEVTAVILPGGMPGSLNLDSSPYTDKAIEAVMKNGGRLAAICAAPLILGRRGLLKGKFAVCYPGFENELKGANVQDVPVLTDGNITTAKGMGVAAEFSLELVRLILGKEKAQEISDGIMRSETVFPCEVCKKSEDGNVDEDEPIDFEALMKTFADELSASAKICEEEYAEPDYSNYEFPPTDLLAINRGTEYDCTEEIAETADKLTDVFERFDVKASIMGADSGPRVTRYEIVPEKNVKVSKITNLFDDIALELAVEGIRMEAPIPGKSAIGLEIPKKRPELVYLRDMIESDEFRTKKSNTFVCIGKDVAGKTVFGDIARMPHLLVAGATGMGKSVCISSMLASILYKARPDEVKLILIDTKTVEFTAYNGIPHLLVPVITDVKGAIGAMKWAIDEMERRYDLFFKNNVRKLDSYNDLVRENTGLGNTLPKIIIVIDELNDLMMQEKKTVEGLIMSITQKARAAGIHMIIGTQRPTSSVLTGVIKANIPTRISCKVSSYVDSKTVLGVSGAEKLLSKGDMLVSLVDKPAPIRVQGAFISDSELERIMSYLRTAPGANIYDDRIMEAMNLSAEKSNRRIASSDNCAVDVEAYLKDGQFIDAVEIAIKQGKISTSLLQRKLAIGYGKAVKFIDAMEALKLISEPNGQKPREVLVTEHEWRRLLENN